jgi:hypothetical protein
LFAMRTEKGRVGAYKSKVRTVPRINTDGTRIRKRVSEPAELFAGRSAGRILRL